MNLTPEQVRAIRTCPSLPLIRAIVEDADIIALMRLGLCVVESGVTDEILLHYDRDAFTSMNEMCDALAAELEKTR